MMFLELGRYRSLVVLAAGLLLACLTLIPIIQYRAASQVENLPIMYD
jgi:hypothetical protein